MPESTKISPTPLKIRPFQVFFNDIRLIFKLDALGKEIAGIAVPAALALAADPIASLIDTAFIGHIGPVELAAVGVSIALFNQASRITIFPLVSITTSFVAEENACRKIAHEAQNQGMVIASHEKGTDEDTQDIKKSCTKENEEANDVEKRIPMQRSVEASSSTGAKKSEKATEEVNENMEKVFSVDIEMNKMVTSTDNSQKVVNGPTSSTQCKENGKCEYRKAHMASVSSALVIGAVLGLLQAIFLIFTAKPLLSIMGVKSGSPMLRSALRYLTLRSLGSPAVLLSLALQGIFRGFKDTKVPLYAIVAGDVANIILDPIFIFSLEMGVSGAAIAHVISQYLISMILLLRLMKRVVILPPSVKALQLGRFLKSGFLLLWRVIGATFCVTLAASLAARLGSTPMAAFQICLQVWMTTSLLADGLAVAGQAILATAFATKDHEKATKATSRVLQLSLVLGSVLAVFVGLGLRFGSAIFTKDKHVMQLIYIGIPFVAATQPINSLAFVFDGINFGASDFAYTAYSMILVAIASIVCLFLLDKSMGFIGIWVALSIYMGLRALAGFGRIGTATGPWRFLRS